MKTGILVETEEQLIDESFKEKILVVDDYPRFRESLAEILMNEQYDIFVAEDGMEAMDILGRESIDLVITDIMMAKINGIEFLKYIKENGPDVEVILITGYESLETAKEALRLGAYDYISKPPDTLRLVHSVKRALSEQKLRREKEMLLLSLTQVAEVIIVIIAADEKVTLINKKGCGILGYNEKEIIGKNWFDNFLPEKVRDEVKSDFKKLMAGEIEPVEYFENPVLTKSDEKRIIAWHNTIIKDKAGNIIGALSSGNDITKSKQAEDARRESEEMYRVLVETSPNGVIVADLEGWITYASPQVLDQRGFNNADEMLGMRPCDFMVEADRKRAIIDFQRVVNGESIRDVEYTLLRKDGASFPAALSASLITDADGNPKAFTAVTRDITEQKLFNEELERRVEQRTKELKETQAQLFQTSKLANLGEMATGLAHEMNQPLGGISLVATYLRKLIEKGKLSQQEIDSGLDDIEASVKRMSKVIGHIRTFARQETLEFTQVDVNETIASALSLLGEQLRLHEIEVVRDLSNYLPKITGEPYQLEQVWINLIVNAQDALDEKEKQITDYKKGFKISTTYNPESFSIEISFSDNGIGIPKEVKEKVFEPFFTTKEVGKATGLGLSISYGIIENHKGKIEVESQEGKGTTVKVILPLDV